MARHVLQHGLPEAGVWRRHSLPLSRRHHALETKSPKYLLSSILMTAAAQLTLHVYGMCWHAETTLSSWQKA